MKLISRFSIVLGFFLMVPSWSQADTEQDVVATLSNVSGVVYILKSQGPAVLGYEGMSVHAGETINTEKDSSVMLLFTDKGQVALRPETTFLITTYHYDETKPDQDNMVIKLLKGGLRSVTGFISKRGNRDAYQLQSATASMGIRGTDYTARLCDTDCQAEQSQQHVIEPSPTGTIGRIAELDGELFAKRSKGETVNLQRLQAFFQEDELTMGDTGHALLVFTDGSRILLQAGASMAMHNYHYDQARPDDGSMIVNMLKGTARIVTGLIGKVHPEKVQFNTVTATIGIRGTAFDVSCGQAGGSACNGEIFVVMREGKTLVKTEMQEIELDNGKTSYVYSAKDNPIVIEQLPTFIKENHNPVPELIPLDTKQLFGAGVQSVPTGLYVSVNDGRVVMIQEGKEVEIAKGESGFAAINGSEPVQVIVIPVFIDNDSVLSKFNFVQGACETQ